MPEIQIEDIIDSLYAIIKTCEDEGADNVDGCLKLADCGHAQTLNFIYGHASNAWLEALKLRNNKGGVSLLK